MTYLIASFSALTFFSWIGKLAYSYSVFRASLKLTNTNF